MSSSPPPADVLQNYVIKRDGRRQRINFDKITVRIDGLRHGLVHADPIVISQKVCQGVYPGVTTVELDELAAETAAWHASEHPDYGTLAARIAVSNLHKETEKSFLKTLLMINGYKDTSTGEPINIIQPELLAFAEKHEARIDAALVFGRDFHFEYFGFRTLMQSYLLKLDGAVVERPQHMFMRCACAMHLNDIDAALETYEYMSQRYFVHASPTLFNSGLVKGQLSSCFLVDMKADSIDGIFQTVSDCASISKAAGGIGFSVHRIRATGTPIAGTNGTSNGLVPMLRVFNNVARYVDQGGGKRKGAFAAYVEPWHADIFEFLLLRKPHGDEQLRARDLFYALWIPDLFMKRVEENKEWTLMCPKKCPGLFDVWGPAFEALYTKYEEEKRGKRVVPARKLWAAIIESQILTGMPYMLYKDACNAKSNQQNLGTIHSSNLCTEIVEYTSPEETAVCNLASISLPAFVQDGKFNHQKLFEVAQVVTRNLNRVIDTSYYPVESAKRSNLKHRPIGIGVQGLADVFLMLRFPFESLEAQELNEDIFETIYFGALTASCDLAIKHGAPYESFAGSPASRGILQFDLWNQPEPRSGRWDWKQLKERIVKHGLRNSLLLAPMPTASTSQILGNNECFEPYTSNLYVRKTSAGEFVCISKHLVNDLMRLKLWTPLIRNKIIKDNGSVQNIYEIPDDIKELYKTAWEIKPRTLLAMSAARGKYICQSQSLNLFVPKPTYESMTSIHFAGWRMGLKTGMYYLRQPAAIDPIKFTVDETLLSKHAVDSSSSSAASVPKSPAKFRPILTERIKRETSEEREPETPLPTLSPQGEEESKAPSKRKEQEPEPAAKEEDVTTQKKARKGKRFDKNNVICTDTICMSCGS